MKKNSKKSIKEKSKEDSKEKDTYNGPRKDKIGLDNLDKRLLFELDKDASQSFSTLGKKLRKSVPAIEYRINNLIEKGIIKSFIALIDYKGLGYTNYFLYWALRNMTPKKEDEIVEFLKKIPNVNGVFRCDGAWELFVGILAKDVFELNEILAKIKEELGGHMDREAFTVHTGAWHFRRNYLVPEEKREIIEYIPITGGKVETAETDKKDLKILSILKDGGRLSSVEVAQKAKLTPDIVRYRINKLKKDNILIGAIFLPNYKNYYLFNRILLKIKHLSKENEKELFNYLNALPNIFRVIKTIGAYEIVIDGEFEDVDSFRKMLFELRSKFYSVIVYYDVLTIREGDKSSYFIG